MEGWGPRGITHISGRKGASLELGDVEHVHRVRAVLEDVLAHLLREMQDVRDRLVRVDLHPRVQQRRAPHRRGSDVEPARLVQQHHHERRRRRPLLDIAPDRHPVQVRPSEQQALCTELVSGERKSEHGKRTLSSTG